MPCRCLILLSLPPFFCQIGNHFVVDASMEEEMCAGAQLFVAINSSHSIVSISKDKFGGLLYSKLQDVILVSGGRMRVE